jgi:Xaa-Pro aminopeptidase
MSSLEIIHEKLDQAVEVLREKEVDLWLTFVRETTQSRDPCLELLLGLDLTWQSALIISRSGERIAIVGRFDVENVERMEGYTTVVGYDQSIREPLLEHLTRLDPRKVALNFSENDPAADGLTHGMFHVLTKVVNGTKYANRLESAEEVIGALRGRKSPTEVSHIRTATQATEAIFRRICRLIRPGLTERELACLFHDAALQERLELAWEADHCPATLCQAISLSSAGTSCRWTLACGRTASFLTCSERGICSTRGRMNRQ